MRRGTLHDGSGGKLLFRATGGALLSKDKSAALTSSGDTVIRDGAVISDFLNSRANV